MTRRIITPEQADQIRELGRKHFAQRDIARKVGVALGVVNRILSEPEPVAPPPRPTLEAGPETIDVVPTNLDPATSLARAAAHLEQACLDARKDKDKARLITAAGRAAQVAALIAKLPKPEPTTDEQAEMLLDRYLAEAKL
jgi:hypothetical protein